MSSLLEHIKTSNGQYIISRRNLEPGHIITTWYDPARSERRRTRQYAMLVINPDWEGHLHGIKLNDVSRTNLISLADEFGLVMDEVMQPKLDVLRMDLEGVQELFYQVSQDKSDTRGGYRTFFRNRMKRTYILNYNWGEDLMRRYFPEMFDDNQNEVTNDD